MIEFKNPLVSVVIPTYNREDRILKSINSVLNQEYKNFEIIIVDDNSSDNTFEVISSFLSERIRYYKNEKNVGGAESRNIGVKYCKGELIAFLDSDDEWLPNKLKLQVEMFEKDPNISMVYTKYFLINEKNQKKSIFHENKNFKSDFKSILSKNFIGTTSTICLRKTVFFDIGGFDKNLKSCQDWDLYIRILENAKVGFIEIPCVNYYYHNDSITGNNANIIEGHKLIFQKIDEYIKNNNISNEEKSVIKSLNYERMAHIYMKSKMFQQGKIFFRKAIKSNSKNLNACKHYISSFMGERLYYKLKKIN